MNLFGKEPRPVFNDIMIEELANDIGKDVHKWCQQNNEYIDLEDCIEAAKSIIIWHLNDNGYQLAKEFEDKLMISPDTELTEILDDVSWQADKILERYVKAWVKSDDIKADLPIGSIVRIKIKNKDVEGEIVQIYDDVAKYGVCVESLGQVKGKSHYLVHFENVGCVPA